MDIMPEEYKGKSRYNQYTSSFSRKWTDKEISWMNEKFKEGYNIKEISKAMGRTETSVQIKRKRLNKKNGTYNKSHLNEKYYINNVFLDYIKPNSVLSLYHGNTNQYDSYKLTSNDIDKNSNALHHKDAFKFCCELYSQDKFFDVIDVDPFGSAYDCFDLCVKMANKGLMITLGELGHKRWKRLDFVNRYYGIDDLNEFTIENLIKNIQIIGLRNKKYLKIFDYKEWQNIGRVWFEIKPYKLSKTEIYGS